MMENRIRKPEVESEVALKTDDGTLYKSLKSMDSNSLAAGGGYFLRYFELSKITDRKESLVPDGILTVRIELSNQKNEDNPSKTSDSIIPGKVGKLQKLVDSPSSIVITWKIPDFLNLPQELGLHNNDASSEHFEIPGGEAFIAFYRNRIRNRDFITFLVTFLPHEGIRIPPIKCEVALKADEGTLYKSLKGMDSNNLVRGGIIPIELVPFEKPIGIEPTDISNFLRYFELSQITDRKESLCPGGVLTVRVELNIQKTEDNPQKLPVTPRVGELNKLQSSPSSVVVTWTIRDFFSLSYDPQNYVLSENFEIPGGTAFITLSPNGTDTIDSITFMVSFMCPPNEGIRKPEVESKVALKTDEGPLYESLMTADSNFLGKGGGYFLHHFKMSEIIARKKSLVPRGVLTVRIKLSSLKNEINL